MKQQADRYVEEALTFVAGGSVSVGFMAQVNEYLQALAFIVAIASGGIVIYKHFKGKSNGNRSAK